MLTECKALMLPSSFALLSYRYADAQMQLGHVEKAVTAARTSIQISESQRMRLATNDRALRLYNEEKASVYSVLIAALVKQEKWEEALLASEQYRARAFIDLASSRQAEKEATAAPQADAAGQLRSGGHTPSI